jgi:dipeptidyl aminopeptidase/acylaminoacyl peptidase
MRITNTLAVAAMLACTSAGASTTPAKPPASHATTKPKAAAPYRSVEVRVRTRDGQTLAGTLTLPLGASRSPAMLLLSSAEAQDRDASNVHGAYHPFRQIADTLSRNGIAVLRLDDRGKGGSSGRLDTLNTAERANDARDALAFLRARRDIDSKRLGVLGHSEGGLIAAMLAAEDTSLRALVSMAATAHPGHGVVEWIARYTIAQQNVAPAVRAQMFQREMQAWRQRIETERWAAYFDTYDPSATARRVLAPALLLQGTADTSCQPSEVNALNMMMRAGGNADVTVQMLDGYDHAFLRIRDFTEGVPYGDGAYLLSSEVLGPIVTWSVKHLR